MATVNGMTAEAMLAIAAGVIVDADVVNDSLILTRYNGTTINAGVVKGEPGTNAAPGSVAVAPDTTIIRTADGRAKFASPTETDDGATKLYVDAKVTPTEIVTGTNLNTLQTTGVYIQTDSGEASLALNYPMITGGLLEVFRNHDGVRIYQRFSPNGVNGAYYYFRVYFSGTWYGWKKYASDPDSEWIGAGGSGPAFQNSWVDYGSTSQVFGYKVVGTRTYLRGRIKNGSVGAVVTLPTSAAPPLKEMFLQAANGGPVLIEVNPTGVVEVSIYYGSNNAWVSLAGMEWDNT